MSKTWKVEISFTFEMESEKEWGPEKEDVAQMVKKKFPAICNFHPLLEGMNEIVPK